MTGADIDSAAGGVIFQPTGALSRESAGRDPGAGRAPICPYETGNKTIMRRPAPVDHPIHEIIRERFSPKGFSERAVDDATLASVLEAARWAPSSFNEQPWYFVVARREDETAFARVLDCLTPKNQAWAKTAAVLILSVANLSFTHNGSANRHALHDVGLASAHLAIQAAALGLGTHMMAGFDAARARAAFAVPEGMEPVAVIALGYPAALESLSPESRERARAARQRKPLKDFVWSGTWGVVWR
jgi:nitroreductase